MYNTTPTLKVKRDGPRGWHWIDAAKYDPAIHTLVDAHEAPPITQPPAAKRRRKPKE
jgi:hypothetical protein